MGSKQSRKCPQISTKPPKKKNKAEITAIRTEAASSVVWPTRFIGVLVFGSRIQAKDHGLGTVQRTAYPT